MQGTELHDPVLWSHFAEDMDQYFSSSKEEKSMDFWQQRGKQQALATAWKYEGK